MAKRVLITDDMMFMRAKLKTILTQMGFEVVDEAVNGEEALQKFQSLQPDLVLMDVTMPVLDGLSALKEIRAKDPKAVVVMVSAMGQESTVKEAIKLGAKNFIVKPFDDEKVRKVLSVYL